MRINLTPSRIAKLRPGKGEFTAWDSSTPHLGVRVKPTGAKRFIHMSKVDGRLRKTTIGDAVRMTLVEARARARNLDSGNVEPPPPCPTLDEWVETVWWPQASKHLKEQTRGGYRAELDRWILPIFGARRLDAIGKSAILVWFERRSRSAPGAANKDLELLSSILTHAVKAEVISLNPARGIRHNPKRVMNRFLDDGERERLLAALDYEPEHRRMNVLVVRMLLFTGCRRDEIRKLRWEEVGDGVINLADSKTGARRVWLGEEACGVLEEARNMREESPHPSEFVFPHPGDPDKCLCRVALGNFWSKVRGRVGLGDVRLHDLRHSFATEAVRQGVPLPVVAKLLGHSNISMTMRYAHASDADAEAAAELVGCHLFAELRGNVGHRTDLGSSG